MITILFGSMEFSENPLSCKIHFIEDIKFATTLEEAYLVAEANVTDSYLIPETYKGLIEYKKDVTEVSIVWTVDDFLWYDMPGEDGKKWSITEDQARAALLDMKKHHDAEIGINWDTVQFFYKKHGTLK